MQESKEITELQQLSRKSGSCGHGRKIRRALLTLAIPATAALAAACYGAPMPQPQAPPPPAETEPAETEPAGDEEQQQQPETQ